MKSIGFIISLFIFISANAQYSSTYEMKKSRKVGFGPVIGGSFGKWGIKFDLNIEEDNGVTAGIGGSDSYNTFNLAWKRDFDGVFTHLYSILGYTQVFSPDRAPQKSEYLIEQLQKPEDGTRISQDLTVLGIGFQYNELGAEYTGLSLFIEADLLHAWKTSKLIPTGTAGITYFF